jgi:hypothetical protein
MKALNIGCIIKILALIGVIMLLALVYLSCSGNSGCLCQRIEKGVPTVTEAPYIVVTHTHIYYAKLVVTDEHGSVAMTGWYEKAGNTWKLHKDTFIIPQILKPMVKRR